MNFSVTEIDPTSISVCLVGVVLDNLENTGITLKTVILLMSFEFSISLVFILRRMKR